MIQRWFAILCFLLSAVFYGASTFAAVESECKLNASFLFTGREGGLPAARIKDGVGRHSGETEVAVIPEQSSMTYDLVRFLYGNLFFEHFISEPRTRKARTWGGRGSSRLSKEQIGDFKKNLKCKGVLSLMGHGSNQRCVLDFGKEAYVGFPNVILRVINGEFCGQEPPFPEKRSSWPGKLPIHSVTQS